MLEKELERKLRMEIKAVGGLCLKWESPGYVGVPDRMILLPGGRILFVEMKAPGKRERPRQQVVQQLLRNMGFEVYSSVDSLSKVQRIVDRCREVIRDEV